MMAKDWDAARSTLHEALELDARLPWTHLLLSMVAYQQRDFLVATSFAKAAIERQPRIPLGRKMLGSCYIELEYYAEAVIELETAVKENPRDSEAFNNLCAAYSRLSNLDLAIRACRSALAIEPTFALPHHNLARLLMRQEDYEGVVAVTEKALQNDHGDVIAGIQLAKAHLELGRLDEAAQRYRDVLAADPTKYLAHNVLGIIALRTGNLDDGIRELRRSLALEPDQTSVLYLLSVGLIARGDYDEAVGLLGQVAKKEPTSGKARYHLARALQALGRRRDAEAALQHACTLEPDLLKYAREDRFLPWIHGKALGVALKSPPNEHAARETSRLATAPVPGFSVVDVLKKAAKQRSKTKTLTCDVQWTVRDDLNLARRERRGIVIIVNGEPNPKFFVEFTYVEGDGILGKRLWSMFDGVLLWIVNERTQQITLRKLSDGITQVDFFKEGVFPVPLAFDLDPSRIYRHFAIFGLGAEHDDPPDTYHLVLIPRNGTRFRRGFDRMDVFVSRTLFVPVEVVVQTVNGLVTERFQFQDVELDAPAFEEAPDLFAPRPDWNAYERNVVPP